VNSKTITQEQELQLQTPSHYGFSAVAVTPDMSAKYTLVVVAVDKSSSVSGFEKELGEMLKTAVESCQKSPNAEQLMVRVVCFNHDIEERHGFKFLNTIKADSYVGSIQPAGGTSLYDACVEAIESAVVYADLLEQSDIMTNGIVFIITDGENTSGKSSANKVKVAIENAKTERAARNGQPAKAPSLESLNVVLVGVVPPGSSTSQYLQDFQQSAGITQYVAIGDGTKGKLAKLGGFVSRSVSSTSQALGTGGPSKSLTF
jgi:hypothetical protein